MRYCFRPLNDFHNAYNRNYHVLQCLYTSNRMYFTQLSRCQLKCIDLVFVIPILNMQSNAKELGGWLRSWVAGQGAGWVIDQCIRSDRAVFNTMITGEFRIPTTQRLAGYSRALLVSFITQQN